MGLTQGLKFWGSDTLGFRIRETMSGHHTFVGEEKAEGKRPIEFTLDWGPTDLTSWLNPFSGDFLRHPVSGTVSIGGLCDEADVTGYMELRYVTERKIRYVFDFEVDETPYHFFGTKSNFTLSNLYRTHTTLNGEIVDLSRRTVVSEATLFFYWSSLPAMVSSFRLT